MRRVKHLADFTDAAGRWRKGGTSPRTDRRAAELIAQGLAEYADAPARRATTKRRATRG